MQIAAIPVAWSCRSSACSSVTRIRAPDAPIGCPRAQAPPCTFIRSCGTPVSAMNAIGTTAKASFTSQRSTSATPQPSRCISFRAAGTGAVGKRAGSCAWLACPSTRARTGSPRARASSSRIKTSAAAPSEIEEEFAAVTVPSLRKAGFSAGIFSGRARPGCSSSVRRRGGRSRGDLGREGAGACAAQRPAQRRQRVGVLRSRG